MLTALIFGGGKLEAQQYDEDKTKRQIEKYQENPKAYYDKVKMMSEKIDEANKNTIKVSEEYTKLLEQKDSILTVYKTQLAKAKAASRATPTSSQSVPTPAPSSATVPATASAPVKEVPAAAKATTTQTTPYRVQLAAFSSQDFAEYFKNASKWLGVERLADRSVVEVSGFTNPDEAREFAQTMRKMGFPGAFMTKYDNGRRIENGVGSPLAIKPNPAAKMGLSQPKPTMLDYPDYIPYGYRELVGVKAAVPAEVKVNELPNPNIPTAASIAANKPKTTAAPKKPGSTQTIPNPLAEARKPAVTAAAPVTKPAAQAAAKPATKPLAAMETPAKVNPTKNDDQLDAAFEQLFKK